MKNSETMRKVTDRARAFEERDLPPHLRYSELEHQYKVINSTFAEKKAHLEDEKMKNLAGKIQHVSRCNYIRLFAFDKTNAIVNDVVSVQHIVKALQTAPTMITLVGLSDVKQSLTWAIGHLYEAPQDFIPYIYEYFKDNNHFGLFVNLTFPALYGFFNIEEMTSYALDFLNELINFDDLEFAKAFAHSFFAGCVVFLDVFWKHFFDLVKGNETNRYRPSIGQIYDILVDALTNSVKYMSAQHIQFAVAYMARYPEQFCECFFEDLLLTTFDIWMSFKPSVSSSKVSHDDLENVFKYIKKHCNDEQFHPIMKAFENNAFAMYEATSAVRYADNAKEFIMISPYEAVMLINMFLTIPKVCNTVKKPRQSFLDSSAATSLNGAMMDFWLKSNLTAHADDNRLLFDTNKLELGAEPDDYKTMRIALNEACTKYFLNPISTIVKCEKKMESDTFYDKLVKSSIKDTSEKFRDHVTSFYYNEIVKNEQVFEKFFMRLDVAYQLESTIQHLEAHGAIVDRFLANNLRGTPYASDVSIFPAHAIRGQIRIDEENAEFIQIKKFANLFHKTLKENTLNDCEYQEFLSQREHLFRPAIRTMDRLDELPIGDRVFLLCDIYNSMKILCEEKNDWIVALLSHIASVAKCRSLFVTFLVIFRFRNTHIEEVKLLTEDIQSAWTALYKFFMDTVNGSSFMDDYHKRSIRIFVG